MWVSTGHKQHARRVTSARARGRRRRRGAPSSAGRGGAASSRSAPRGSGRKCAGPRRCRARRRPRPPASRMRVAEARERLAEGRRSRRSRREAAPERPVGPLDAARADEQPRESSPRKTRCTQPCIRAKTRRGSSAVRAGAAPRRASASVELGADGLHVAERDATTPGGRRAPGREGARSRARGRPGPGATRLDVAAAPHVVQGALERGVRLQERAPGERVHREDDRGHVLVRAERPLHRRLHGLLAPRALHPQLPVATHEPTPCACEGPFPPVPAERTRRAGRCAVLVDDADERRDPRPVARRRGHDGRRRAEDAGVREADERGLKLGPRPLAGGPGSALFTTNRSGASMTPAFRCCRVSPAPGCTTNRSVSTTSRDVRLALPDADRLDDDDVERGGKDERPVWQPPAPARRARRASRASG